MASTPQLGADYAGISVYRFARPGAVALSKFFTMPYVLARSDAPFYEVAPTQGGRRHERAGPSAARHLED